MIRRCQEDCDMISRQAGRSLQFAGLLLSSMFVLGCAKDSLFSAFSPTGLPKMTEPELEDEDADHRDTKRVAEKDEDE